MNRYALAFLTGVIVFAMGWAIRSTFIMHTYVNKPIGGALITVGFLIIGIAVYQTIKNR